MAVVTVTAGTASAEVRPGAEPGTVTLSTRNLHLTAADTSCFKKSYPNCASSDPAVSFQLVSRGDTSACSFTLSTTWGDGAGGTLDFSGGPDGTLLTPVKHTYTKPKPFVAPKTYAVTWSVTVRSGSNCRPSSDKLSFARTCTSSSLSGPAWAARFPTSTRFEDLKDGFREQVTSFVRAMRSGGITVVPRATLRPPQRAYMMHYAWLIAKKKTSADKVPPFKPAAGQAPVDICWQHTKADGTFDSAASVAAAQRLVTAFGIDPNLRVAPSLTTLHTQGLAIDMTTTWSARSITVTDHGGHRVTISTTPHTGLNTKLISVGRSYGVIHYSSPPEDDPNHWSTNGH
ncbi:hypothetical protein JK359_10475 [Streptomyces actinomycinicus]|uniref:Uncharacterized protein n=1 Tax=Streptomyces actinomycinicus TaxID=1695166 RepID=A0A937EH34_9ACTN|nr:hypothetical protein [Streptomyces actinomycinicus]MBL1082403.1 hypothetical protein [Streptomyces actinomycinicus]